MRPEVQGGRAAGAVGTIAVHGAVVAVAFAMARPPKPMPPVYAVELVAAPAPVAAPTAPVATAPPAPTPTPAVSRTPPKPSRTPAVKTPPPKPEPVRTPPRAATTPNPGAQTSRTTQSSAVTPAPGETPSNGTDPVTVKTPGLTFAYPEYLRNIVAQVYRRWERPRGGTRRAEVFFMILRDGSVRDIRFTTPSGDFTFDLAAQGAIEAAANAGAFGPLPDGYPQDVLPVSFYFEPGRTR
ncbi:MAG TPA: TonB C-terminal domain-containing protein [Gemmatimonadales bacterium]|nr:TonB C-terminal domain-containing protein [Gemmatimonadales bacterium]